MFATHNLTLINTDCENSLTQETLQYLTEIIQTWSIQLSLILDFAWINTGESEQLVCQFCLQLVLVNEASGV